MKKLRVHSIILFGLFSFLILSFTSCLKDECDETRVFLEYEAIYLQPEEFRLDVQYLQAREMENPGKFYFYQNYIFVNEKYAGIHVIDNNDPVNPVNIGFLDIRGNIDVAIRGNILYADNYIDLLSIDISDITNPRITCRDEGVFATQYDPSRGYYMYNKSTEREIEVDCSDPHFGDDSFIRNGNILMQTDLAGGAIFINAEANASGTAGSFARFSVSHDHLYVLNLNDLIAYNLENPEKPMETNTTNVSWGNIETLFPYEQYLFIGANNGMYIYDATNPAAPQYVSEFHHARACDPVFVKDDIAYVTLRNGTFCESFSNQLDVIDVSNISSPQLIASFDMDHPHGLSVVDNNLYLCEGTHGLKVFETDDLTEINDNQIDHIKNIHAYDAIGLSSTHLLIIGDGGLYQFDTSDPSNLKEISFYPVAK